MSGRRHAAVRLAVAVLVAATLATAVAAQAPPTTTPAAYTALEQARIRELNLLARLRDALEDADRCRSELAELRGPALSKQIGDLLQALKVDVEASRPGFLWDPKTGAFTKAPTAADPKQQEP